MPSFIVQRVIPRIFWLSNSFSPWSLNFWPQLKLSRSASPTVGVSRAFKPFISAPCDEHNHKTWNLYSVSADGNVELNSMYIIIYIFHVKYLNVNKHNPFYRYFHHGTKRTARNALWARACCVWWTSLVSTLYILKYVSDAWRTFVMDFIDV